MPSFGSREPFDGASLHDDTGRIRAVGESVTVVIDAIVANLLNALVYDTVAVVVDAVVADLDGPAVAASGSVGGAVTIVIDAVAADVHAKALLLPILVRHSPERPVITVFDALERRPEGRVAHVSARGRVDRRNPNLILFVILWT